MSSTNTDKPSGLHRVGGRLHRVHHIRDDEGNLIATVTGPLKVEFRLEDFGQLVAGACLIALPVSMTEEVWTLGETLSFGRTLAILALSLITLTGFVWSLFYGKQVAENKGHFFKRALSTYLVTFLIALLLLVLFDKAPLDDLGVTLTRTIIVAFPSSFAASAVDFMK